MNPRGRTFASAAVALALALTGCGPDPQPVVQASTETVDSVVAKLGCTGTFHRDGPGERQPFVADSGSCTIGVDRVAIYDFGTREASERWWDVAFFQRGDTPDQGVTLGLVYVRPANLALLPQVRAALERGSPAPTPLVTPSPTGTSDAPGAPSEMPSATVEGLDAQGEFLTMVDTLSTGLRHEETEAGLVDLGWSICDALDSGGTLEGVYGVLANTFDDDQVSALITASITALCPEYEGNFG